MQKDTLGRGHCLNELKQRVCGVCSGMHARSNVDGMEAVQRTVKKLIKNRSHRVLSCSREFGIYIIELENQQAFLKHRIAFSSIFIY